MITFRRLQTSFSAIIMIPKTLYNKIVNSPQNVKSLSVLSPRYWELELMLLLSIKYDFTILRRVIMTLILLKTIHTLHYPDDIARLWNSDGHVLAKWYYCDHQSALAEYSLIPLSVLSLGGVSVCFTRPAVEKWWSLRPGSAQCE